MSETDREMYESLLRLKEELKAEIEKRKQTMRSAAYAVAHVLLRDDSFDEMELGAMDAWKALTGTDWSVETYRKLFPRNPEAEKRFLAMLPRAELHRQREEDRAKSQAIIGNVSDGPVLTSANSILKSIFKAEDIKKRGGES
jgi:hypothetical protein